MTRKISQYETYDYWFNNPDHDIWDQGGSGSFIYTWYKDIVCNLDIPNEGYIVVAGTHRCVPFNLLCEKFGSERCIGYDLYNPTNHPRVIIKDCFELSDHDNIPIAFAHNDVGNMPLTPELKIYTHKWLAKNIVKGGWLMGNNNLNRAKYKAEEYLVEHGFQNTQFADLPNYTKNLTLNQIEGYMVSQKIA